MIEMISKSGKRIGIISDCTNEDDQLFIDGKKISLSDAYSDENIKNNFNKHVLSLKDSKNEPKA